MPPGILSPKDGECFTDVSTDSWYTPSILSVLESGLMNGHGRGTFAPEEKLTRAQTAQILYNREQQKPWFDSSELPDGGFSDVHPGDWYADAVNWAASEGVVFGYGNGSFGCKNPVTREQLITILYRSAGSPAANGSLEAFKDGDTVQEYAVDAMKWAVANGLIQGRTGGLLVPSGTATRAEAAAILTRFFK